MGEGFPPLMTTRVAAVYCGYKTTGALRKAFMEGRVRPAGRRGGRGSYMWAREELDRFLRGDPPSDTIRGGPPGAPPLGGDNEEDQVGQKMELMDRAEAHSAGGVSEKGGRLSGGEPGIPRAMRRTFQDLARTAEVKDVVTRAISGHATEQMQRHYSTVNADEVAVSIGKVISLARAREALDRQVVIPKWEGEGAVKGKTGER